MTNRILTIVLVAVHLGCGINAIQADDEGGDTALNSFSYDFEEDDDRNYDTWPDDWTRRTGAGFPHYVQIGIDSDAGMESEPDASESSRYLRIQLDGGAAEAIAPERWIDTRFSYYLECDIRTFETETREENEAWVSVEYRDEEGRLKAKFTSERIKHQSEFERLTLGPMIVPDEVRCRVVVRLHVEPTRSSDLYGGACFDNIELKPYPRLLITTNRPHNILKRSQSAEITCRVSGVQQEGGRLSFQLFDAFGEAVGPPEIRSLIDTLVTTGDGQLFGPQSTTGSPSSQSLLDSLDDGDDYDFNRELTIRWNPPIDGQGFYRVRVKLLVGDEVSLVREQTLAVVDNEYRTGDIHFGWSVPQQSSRTSLPQFTELIRQSGVYCIKYPVWFAKSDNASADWIAEFADRLHVAGIQFIGVLDVPPEEHREPFARTDMRIASVMREPELWQPALQHVLTRLSLKIHRWQLGADDDLSFVGYPDVYEKVSEIREALLRYAKDIEVSVAWKWLNYVPMDDTTPWDHALHLAEPELTAGELAHYLKMSGNEPDRVWTSLQPLSSDDYDLQSRVRDLVGRMVQIKIAGNRGFVIRPFSDKDGLLRHDGSPTALYLPFRTTSVQLAGLTYLGKLQLPNKSENFVFGNDKTAVMMIWSQSPTTEELYLGEEVAVTDIWGRRKPAERKGDRQIIQVDAWPTFVTGLNLHVTKFRLGFDFNRERLASVFGQRQTAGFKFENTFASGASGRVKMHSDRLWSKPIDLHFKVAQGEKIDKEFELALRSFASTGRHPVRVDFIIDADRQYEFTVYRDVQVGYGLIEIEHHLEDIDNGVVRVRATLVNNSYEDVSFNCMLLIPGQRRQRRQILRLGHGRETVEFQLRGTKQLEGQMMWLRAEEIRGNRVLNHHFSLEQVTGSTNPE